MQNPVWKRQSGLFGGTNFTLKGDGFYVSYNPCTASLGGMLAGDYGDGEETALCKDGDFFILNGDFRSSYENIVSQGWEACKRFFDQQQAHARSSWTEENGKIDRMNLSS